MARLGTLLALDVSKDGACFKVIRVPRTHKCSSCGYEWAVVQEIPYTVSWEHRFKFNALLICPGTSNTGLHYARTIVELPPEGGFGFKPTGRRGEYIALGEYEIQPAQLPHEWPVIAVFVADWPFLHEEAVVGMHKNELFPEAEERECGRCFRQRIWEQPDYRQGRLRIKHDCLRLCTGCTGVSTFSANDEEIEIGFFNHTIRLLNATLCLRGDIGSLWIYGNGQVRITSPDHPDEEIILREPGPYNLYHPWPRHQVD